MKSNRKAAFSVRQRGFTMAEVLVVMAIIMVLSGIAVPNATRILNNARQMSLNRSAETIYMTAQRNLIAYKVQGHPTAPQDHTSGYMVTSYDSRATNPAYNIVLPVNTLSPSLSAGNWSIEYGSDFLVKKVYYSEDLTLTDLAVTYNSNVIGKVGYYG